MPAIGCAGVSHLPKHKSKPPTQAICCTRLNVKEASDLGGGGNLPDPRQRLSRDGTIILSNRRYQYGQGGATGH